MLGNLGLDGLGVRPSTFRASSGIQTMSPGPRSLDFLELLELLELLKSLKPNLPEGRIAVFYFFWNRALARVSWSLLSKVVLSPRRGVDLGTTSGPKMLPETGLFWIKTSRKSNQTNRICTDGSKNANPRACSHPIDPALCNLSPDRSGASKKLY